MKRCERAEQLAETKEKLAAKYERLVKTANSKPKRQRFKHRVESLRRQARQLREGKALRQSSMPIWAIIDRLKGESPMLARQAAVLFGDGRGLYHDGHSHDSRHRNVSSPQNGRLF